VRGSACGRRFPTSLGIVLGVGITAGLTGLGIGALLADLPWLKTGLSVLAAAWILWMAVQLWRARPAAGATAEDAPWGVSAGRTVPMGEPEALGDHAGGGIGLRPRPVAVGGGAAPRLRLFGDQPFRLLFWAFTGSLCRRLLTDEQGVAIFTRVMATGLAVSAVMVFV
jgi:hypothetical protein